MISRAMIGKWFHLRRGRVFAISGVVVAFGFSGAPKVFDLLMSWSDWRGAWLMLAGAIGIGMTSVGWLFYRDAPEECGLAMDGAVGQEGAEGGLNGHKIVKEFTAPEARKTLAFWAFNLGTAAYGLIGTAFAFHIVSLGEEMGMPKNEALKLFIPIAAVSVVFNVMSGWASDRIRMKYILMAAMAFLAVGLGGIPLMPAIYGKYMMILGMGGCGGIWGILVSATWPKFFGREHLGAISGLNMATMVVASAMGPYCFSLAKQYGGSYQWAVMSSLLLPLVVITLAMRADNPQEPEE